MTIQPPGGARREVKPPRRVIIDTDPGIDDVVAITLAARGGK